MNTMPPGQRNRARDVDSKSKTTSCRASLFGTLDSNQKVLSRFRGPLSHSTIYVYTQIEGSLIRQAWRAGKPSGVRRCDAARREAWNSQRCPAKWRNWEDRPQPTQILLRGAPLPAFCACSRTWIGPEQGRGRGWSIQRRSFKAGRGKAGLDQV